MIQKHPSLAVANQVLSLVNFRIETELADKLTVECLANGREQGLHIFGAVANAKRQTAVSFGQDRHNDDIVVYASIKSKFSPQGNYYEGDNEPKRFKAGDYDAAADYILAFFGQVRK